MSQENSQMSGVFASMMESQIGDGPIAVKAEDIQNGGIDYSKHFFEPQVGNTYLLKFLPNPGSNDGPIVHRYVYKDLPDPDRKGKTFHYVSSGNAKSCKVLDLFFKLNELKKDGDAIAEKKIDKYLSKTNQSCVKVQILQSPKQEEVGMIKLFVFANFGPNASVANLINAKLNPTKEQVEQGFNREDIFNIFEASVMSLVVKESNYDGQKGRDFSQSMWTPKKRGAIVKLENGSTREFTANDIQNKQLVAEAIPYFNELGKILTSDDLSILKWFGYKTPNDTNLDKETLDYIKSVWKKVDEIVPVIEEKTLQEIASYGKAERPSNGGSEAKPDNAKNVMANAVPSELAGSVVSAENQQTQQSQATASKDGELDDIINQA